MEKIKIQDIRNGAIKEVKKALSGDFIGTGNFKLYEEKKVTKEEEPKKTIFTKKED